MTITPELDENGKPISPGGEQVTLTKEEHEKMVLELAQKAQAEASLLNEVTQLRKKNAELKEEKKPEPTEVAKVVQQELAKKEADVTKANYEEASRLFLDAHPEFSPENDPGGVKFAAFNKALSRINLTTLKSVTDFEEALNDAHGLMERKATGPVNQSASPRGGAMVPKTQPNAHLPENEQKVVKDYFKGDTDAYLKAKAKRPEFYATLLQYTR